MALLAAVFFILIPFRITPQGETSPVAIFFNPDAPEYSVGVIEDQIVEIGSIFEHYQVMLFDPDSILLEDLESQEKLRLPVSGDLNEKIKRQARHFFIVKQLKQIDEGQTRYFRKFGYYAQDFESLTQTGCLNEGFHNAKSGYEFRFEEIKKNKHSQPQYWILAAPLEEIRPDLFFSVDALGLVRIGDSADQALWGPAWDYEGQQDLEYEYLGVNKDYEEKG